MGRDGIFKTGSFEGPTSEVDLLLPGGASLLSAQRAVRLPTVTSSGQGSKVVLEDKYCLEEEIGRGGMGIVMKAVDESLGRDVAIKLLRPEFQDRPRLVDRFRNEARAMATIRHENVVQIYSRGQQEGMDFFVMELIRGETARAKLIAAQSQGALLPLDGVVHLLDHACAGMAAIHEAGVVHRDLTPTNMFCEVVTGRCVIMDFGLGRDARRADAARREVVTSGTPGYLAPEVLEGRELEGWEEALADIYSFGVTAYELMTGRHPFLADSWEETKERQLTTNPPPPSSLRPEIDEALDAVVLQCLERDPARRSQWFYDVRGALQAFLLRSPTPLSAVEKLGGASSSPAPPAQVVSSKSVSFATVERAREHSEVRAISEARAREMEVDVLVVSDDSSFRSTVFEVARSVASVSSFRAARSSLAGLRAVQLNPPTVLIAPLQDNSLNGLELAAALRGEPSLQQVKLVLVAGAPSKKDMELLQFLGVNRVISHPVDRATLAEALRAAVETARDEHQNSPSVKKPKKVV